MKDKEQKKNVVPATAGLFLTRKCNNTCQYCQLRSMGSLNEFNSVKWRQAVDIIDNLGIKKLVLLGGEPTLVRGIEKIIAHCTNLENLKDVTLLSNSLVSKKKIDRIVDAGLRSYSTTVETVSSQGYDASSARKSVKALEMLSYLRGRMDKTTGYFVLHKGNIGQSLEVAKRLNDMGTWFYTIPLHHGKESFWQNRSSGTSNAFNEDDRYDLETLSEKLLSLKSGGALIGNSEEYLRNLSRYAIFLDWKCLPSASELRVDADGSLMCCNDIRGHVSNNWSIFDLTSMEQLQQFQTDRALDAVDCPGCFWPSQFSAVEITKAK